MNASPAPERREREASHALTLEALLSAYYKIEPDMENPAQRVCFGTSGHRGSSLLGGFNEAHILAVSQAVCDYRASWGVHGPLFMGKDTHVLSGPALETALEVMAANGVQVRIQRDDLPIPTPVVSHAILVHNSRCTGGIADGVVVTPSHNPPEDGGFKYNEQHGGPAGTEATSWIQTRANEYLADKNSRVRRLPSGPAARKALCVREIDFIGPYVADLKNILDMKAIADSGLRLGADPLGGSSLSLWRPIADAYEINLTLVNPIVDPLFSFMPPDHDGKIRMDCSSPYAMAGLLALAKDYDIAFGNDPDADRHGIVTARGLMSPNDYLCAAVWYLLLHRPHWPQGAAVGKTVVTTSLLDSLCRLHGRAVHETPVGFKWFVQGLAGSTLLFAGEESAGASFLRAQGQSWTTDKDGIILNLLAAEIMAVTGVSPAELYEEITERLFVPHYARLDVPASPEQKKALTGMSPSSVTRKELAGSPIVRVLTSAPGNGAPIGGLKVSTKDGWFAARPSGTEDIYKIYAESFVSPEHLRLLQKEARELAAGVFAPL